MDIINNKLTIKEITNPYPIWIVDNFFNENTLNKIKLEWPDINSPLWHKGHQYIDGKENILEQGMCSISKLKDIPKYSSKILNYIHTKKFTDFISSITNIKDLLPDESFRWSGLRTMIPGSFQAIHSDARLNPETGFRKELTCLVYLNEHYIKDKDKGCFEVWNDDMTKCMHKIEPINNRLVIFLNTNTSYHGVPEVNFERKAILWSILKNAETNNRSKALFVSRPKDSDEISKLGKKRANIKDAM